EGVLRKMGIEEPKENQTLEKRIVIKDVERERYVEVQTGNPLIGVYLQNGSFWDEDEKTQISNKNGVLVTSVTTDGAAQMAGLQKGDALKEVDYYSTVSGGGFAGGAYIGSLYNYWYRVSSDPGFRDSGARYSLGDAFDQKIEKDLNRSYVDPMLKSFFFSMRAWFSHVDEGDALERAVDTYVLGHKWRNQLDKKNSSSIKLGDMFVRKEEDRQVLLPMMVANGTIYPSMAIFPFTPDILEEYEVSGYTHRMKKVDHEKGMDPMELPLSVGIKASGSFPVMISNTTLISNQDPLYRYLHIIDGGVADNIGYKTAIEMLRQDTVSKGKFLFVVDADAGGQVPTFSKKQGGAFSLGVYSKMATSGLDSRHVVLEKELNNLCVLHDITPIFFNFASLLEGLDEFPEKQFSRKREMKRVEELLRTSPDSVTVGDLPILYELARNVKTKYTITKLEQKLMIQTGKKVVELRRPEIEKALRRNQ
ncbi:PDZ domain-containing protein, partial [bacterium]|nr:PDZ domain-containing protein [bacterium]